MPLCRLMLLVLAMAAVVPAVAIDVPKEMDIVKEMVPLTGFTFRSPRVARLVNELRHLGKKRAIRVIRNYDRTEHGKYNDQLILICSILFENPSGKIRVGLGAPFPSVSDQAISEFEDFPIAFSEGIPFFVVYAFNSGGRGERLESFLIRHKKLRFKQSDIPETGFEESARLLIESDRFKHLYPDDHMRQRMSKMIIAQASPDPGKFGEKQAILLRPDWHSIKRR